MNGIIDKGTGTPIVLVPALQGRWEWMRPTVDALARHHRVITFSLCDEPTSLFPCDPGRAFENYIEQIDLAFDRVQLEKAVIVGVSFGGLIASEFAARRPERVEALVLASALHRTWRPDSAQRRYLNAPTLLSPLFVATAPVRMRPEMTAALPRFTMRARFAAAHGMRILTALTTPSRMARRLKWAVAHTFADVRGVKAPALIVTGEPGLDRVVPVDLTRKYLDELRSAKHVVLPRTGHIGVVTKPDEFADVLGRFVDGVGRCA